MWLNDRAAAYGIRSSESLCNLSLWGASSLFRSQQMVLPARLGLSAAAAEHRWIPECREMSLCWASSHSAKTTGFAEHPDSKISSPPPAFSRPNTLRSQQGLRPKTTMNDSMFIAEVERPAVPWCELSAMVCLGAATTHVLWHMSLWASHCSSQWASYQHLALSQEGSGAQPPSAEIWI